MSGVLRKAGKLALGASTLAVALAWPGMVAAQEEGGTTGGRARVLVAPLAVPDGVDGDFGKDVAEEVGKKLRDFPTLTSIEGKVVRDELKRLKLDMDELGKVQWRQLAGRINAQVVMWGEVTRGGSAGHEVHVTFIDAKTGDELDVPTIRIRDDGGDAVDHTADRIAAAFQDHVDYQQAILFCQDYLAAEQYEDALRNCNQALELNPSSSTALYLRGRVHMGREEWDAAREDLATVVEENSAQVLALQSLAYTNAQLGNMDRAMELYREYLNYNPADASVRMNIAFNLAQAGGHDAAIQLLQEGLEQDSTNAALWEFLGNVALSKGTTGEGANVQGSNASVRDADAVRTAVRAYDKVLELKGDSINPQILRNVIAANLELGDYEAALDFADRAQRLMPDDAGLWSIRADVYGRMERYGDAVDALDRVIELNPEYQNAYLRRGLFKLRAGNSRGAIADLRAAIDRGTDPNLVAQQLLARGHADYFQKGEYDTALDMFEVGAEFATTAEVRDQLFFFTAYGYYLQGVEIDQSNEAAEACGPARRALEKFQQVLPNLNRAGQVQPQSQAQIRESTDVYLYRQEQIIKKDCGG